MIAKIREHFDRLKEEIGEIEICWPKRAQHVGAEVLHVYFANYGYDVALLSRILDAANALEEDCPGREVSIGCYEGRLGMMVDF